MNQLQKIEKESIFHKTKPKEFRDRIKVSVRATINAFMGSRPEMIEVSCPFCGDNESIVGFSVDNFLYRRCSSCFSSYSSPRPTQEAMTYFYAMQPAELVDSELLPEMRHRRIEMVMKPRWVQLRSRLEAQGIRFPVNKIMEVGAGIGHFLEVMQTAGAALHYVAVEPAQACEARLVSLPNTSVFVMTLEQVPESCGGGCDLLFMNSVIEHPYSLQKFFNTVREMLKPGGIVALVDMHSGGLDLEVLRGEAQNVNPLLILQIGSIEGVRQLAERCGLTLIDAFAMGQMDVDILHEYAQGVAEGHPLRGFAYLLDNEALRDDLQGILRRHNATGYMGYLLKRIG